MSKEGRKYYYNRVTKESKWEIPDELKHKNGDNAPEIANFVTPILVDIANKAEE